MRKICLLTLAVVVLASPAMALDGALKAGLLKLDPETRLEQRCDAEALDRIGKDGSHYKPDRVVAYAMATPTMLTDAIESPGAAFRSKGEWYKLAYVCKTAPDHMKVLSFEYQIGDAIAEADWQKYNLWQ
ncbi:DUF930 domain-containing protein [Mesorhizobium sp. CGMCC 1.15528]|jgi:hypothetical protein|uniref:DUF930 domain-containing protein n=1 Tax=Mesorhizobium zhangyense TaxID=1776730 RepID=A0A7C9V4K4_9HYPH|nr:MULTISPECIES: DUF930 domain-containing protein [Mesorhizobium]NGN40244.1 DUF930 domain-containing protein [Mesorhizobium zhangyense]RJG46572.1 DUF930 domain-containing protein [Mesorhizobium sp. DCY119]SFT99313.1 protein of unknown function [Mesorhizobium sp. YR577]